MKRVKKAIKKTKDPIKKMEVLLNLPLYLILFLIWWRFRHVIKAMTDVKNILNDDDFFSDIVDAPKEDTEQRRKREYLRSVISRGKVYLLGSEWTQGQVDKASDETINKTYALYKQRELNEKGEKTGKALSKDVINLYSSVISWVVKIREVKKLRQDIENDSIIKDQMTNLGFLLVSTFGDYLAPILVDVHLVNNLDRGNELENKGYESD